LQYSSGGPSAQAKRGGGSPATSRRKLVPTSCASGNHRRRRRKALSRFGGGTDEDARAARRPGRCGAIASYGAEFSARPTVHPPPFRFSPSPAARLGACCVGCVGCIKQNPGTWPHRGSESDRLDRSICIHLCPRPSPAQSFTSRPRNNQKNTLPASVSMACCGNPADRACGSGLADRSPPWGRQTTAALLTGGPPPPPIPPAQLPRSVARAGPGPHPPGRDSAHTGHLGGTD